MKALTLPMVALSSWPTVTVNGCSPLAWTLVKVILTPSMAVKVLLA